MLFFPSEKVKKFRLTGSRQVVRQYVSQPVIKPVAVAAAADLSRRRKKRQIEKAYKEKEYKEQE